MKTLVLALALALAGNSGFAADPATAPVNDYVRPPAKKGYSYPECYCTDSRGQRVEVGQIACLTIGQQKMTSRCEKVRNLVIWRHQSKGCAPGV